MRFIKYSVTALIFSAICFESAFCWLAMTVPLRKVPVLIPELEDVFKHSDDIVEYSFKNFELTDENRQAMEVMMLQDKIAKNGVNDDFHDESISFKDIFDIFINTGSSKRNNEEHLELTLNNANQIVASIYERFHEIASRDPEVWEIFDISDTVHLMEPKIRKLAEMRVMQKKLVQGMFDDADMKDIINRQFEIYVDYVKNQENLAKFELTKIGYLLVCEQKMSSEVAEIIPKKFYNILKEISIFKDTTGISHKHLIKIAMFRLLYSFDVLLPEPPRMESTVGILRLVIEDDMTKDICS